MNYASLTLAELQNFGACGDEKALCELGRRVVDYSICDRDRMCEHLWELDELKAALDNEIPSECPHCGHWLSDV